MSKIAKLLMVLWISFGLAVPALGALKLGVNAPRGPLKAHAKWDELARYLSEQVGEAVEIVPMGPKQIYQAAKQETLDFTLVNPLNTYSVQASFSATPIATTLSLVNGNRLGGVIVASKESGILHAHDLIGKNVFAYKIGASAAAYAFQTKYLLDQGIDPHKDFASFRSAKRQDEIVLAVKNDLIDAGFVKTGLIEAMVKEGKLTLDDIVVVDNKQNSDYPWLHSTYLYPGWTLSSLHHVDEALSHKIQQAVLALPTNSLAAKRARLKGFTLPPDFSAVAQLMRDLKMPPFDQ